MSTILDVKTFPLLRACSYPYFARRAGRVAERRPPVAAHLVHPLGAAPQFAAGPELADPVVLGVEAARPARRRAERVERMDADRGQLCGRVEQRERERPGRGAQFGPLLEAAEQHALRLHGIHLGTSVAQAVVLVGDHVQPREVLAGGESSGMPHDGLVVVDRAERGDLLIRPSLVDDYFAAGALE